MGSIFLTGASGYIGGQVLRELAHAHPQYTVAALVRDVQVGKKILEAYPKVRIVNGSLDDVDLIESETAQASVTLNLASNKHIPSTEAIHRGLQKKGSGYWIQITGASALAVEELASDSYKPGSPSSTVYDDIADVVKLRSLVQNHSGVRKVDDCVLNVAAKASSIKTALVWPPIIFGQGQGPINQRSVQIPSLSKVTLEKGHGVRVGAGESRWGNIYIRDLGRLFAALVEASIKGNQDENLWGENGIYLTGVGEIPFGEISERIAKTAVDQGYNKSADLEELGKDAANTVLPAGATFFGTNARSKVRRATEFLGWKPSENSLGDEIPRAVKEEADSLGGKISSKIQAKDVGSSILKTET